MYKYILKAKFLIIIIIFLLSSSAYLSSTARAASAENGEWIAYPFVYPTTGSVYAVCGEDCIGFAKQVADSILFFDINKSAWTEHRFDVQQTIRYMEAKGHTIFAYTDEFLIGYSSFTCNYDMIPYGGVLLAPTGYNPSYGCGRNLAFFVTNETMYVFDSELGRWQKYDYGLPVDYSGSGYIIRDDYVWVVLKRGDYGALQPKNVVYSLHKHSFNQTESGCSFTEYEYLDHGFAGCYTHDVENYTLIGYSAYTNEFDLVQVTNQGHSIDRKSAGDSDIGDITVYAVCFVENLDPSGERGYFYGYDTSLGYWSNTTVDFPVEQRWSESWMPGGQFSISSAVLPGEIYKFIIYSGVTGNFSVKQHGLTYDSVTSFTLCGGEVLVVYDNDTVWGYSFVTEGSSMLSSDKPDTEFGVTAEDFCALGRQSTESSVMTMYIYNSKTNNWTTIDLPKIISAVACNNREHVFVYSSTESSFRETVFYSSFLDSYVKCEFPVNSSVSLDVGYNLAWASSSNKSYLFDAQRGIIYPFDFMFTTNGLGDFAASFYNAETKILYGYSALSGQWTNLTISDTPYSCNNEGLIGLISNNAYSKYYTFNGLTDSWVELVPSGTYKRHIVSEKTALVVRSNMLYAFDPNGRIGTYNYLIEFEGNFFPISLFTNSTISNFSFNESLKEISFNVTGQDSTIGFCNLTLPNTLVQNLWQGTFTVLVDGEQPMHISTWTDGTYTYLYFTYVHSEHEVVIIPEFSPSIILPLFIGVTLLTVMFSRRKHSRLNASKG